ncbi:DUF1932 domain-containing protein [Polymorphum gilvum]|uniref:Phosphogluconate dehydrogenase, NAD-binding, putative-like protein n=1 Tax=Polymorphum gilvum (strain LMG 25793 / CGMCC 1.9160 / SL003B-26A1) TaxID=991905 RepID=F2J6A9_POLGS|nr:NAD(P)-dependent oxidoreductase [Polymorphum gilvum]ADZ71283.1 Phosphogluconate dehydrogenase, NAD-binding, putative-like protein [Polymorphum gilvum SL003B-26A1]
MKLAFIGFGEAARAFVDSLKETGVPVSFSAYDILQGTAGEAPVVEAAAQRGVALAASPAAAVDGAGWVISAVTAAESYNAAVSVADVLQPGQVYVDINSVSGQRKADTAALVCRGGAAYVDMAVMAPVHPRGHRTPVLVAGALASGTVDRLDGFGFAYEVVGERVGAATSIKMVRSLFVKGLEAITVQALLAAEAAGCYERVYGSLSTSFRQLGWPEFGAYQFERVTRHGRRRAAEMRESARSMADLGFAGGQHLADAIADVQDEIGSLGLILDDTADLADLVRAVADRRRAAG